jgi:hypothetical protein
VDLEDPEFPPVRLSEDMVRQWQVDPPGLIQRFRSVNKLSGPFELLQPRIWLLGEVDSEEGPVGVCLAFNGHQDILPFASGIPTLLGSRYARVIVGARQGAAPSLVDRLAQMKVTVSALVDEEPLRIKDVRLPGGLFFDAGLWRNEDYSVIHWRDQTFTLYQAEAFVVQRLHQASKTLSPAVLDARLVAAVQDAGLTEATELRDILRRSGVWNTLVVSGSRRGYYRLELP